MSLVKKILIVVLCVLAWFLYHKGYKIMNKREYTNGVKQILQWEAEGKIGASVKPVIFEKEGVDNIALVTMVKDEEDIIYENLVWHFCVGFRKFVIVDNNSTDKTRELIEKFKSQTDGKALVIIIEDPILEYIQSAVTSGAMYFAKSIWPKTEWVFPVDADEFWYPSVKLSDVLKSVPANQDAILTLQYNHFFTETADKFDPSKPFYENIPYRLNVLEGTLGKIALRPRLDTIIEQGNHSIKLPGLTKYAHGNKIGLDMRHFQRRSLEQINKKYSNGAKANIAGQKKGVVGIDAGTGWTKFQEEVDKKGLEQAVIDRFNEFVINKANAVHDPLPMQEAFALFEELVKE